TAAAHHGAKVEDGVVAHAVADIGVHVDVSSAHHHRFTRLQTLRVQFHQHTLRVTCRHVAAQHGHRAVGLEDAFDAGCHVSAHPDLGDVSLVLHPVTLAVIAADLARANTLEGGQGGVVATRGFLFVH